MKKLTVIFPLLILVLLAVGLAISVKQVGKKQEVRTRAAALPQYHQVSEVSGQAGAGEAGGSNEAETGKWIIPSISGFSSDPFTGTATLSYPIQIPAGINGVQPGLNLSYSSSAIDDVRMKEENDAQWQYMYKVQASYVGLGWNLGGLGYITKDRSVYPHAYYLVFPGGSAKLYKKTANECSGSANYEKCVNEEWETSPRSFAQIYHHKNNHHGYHDTNHWEVITKDGTHYIFGEQIEEGGKPETWVASRLGSNDSPTSLIMYRPDPAHPDNYKYEPNKWALSHTYDIHGNDIKYHYSQSTYQYNAHGQERGCYTRVILPDYIEYGRVGSLADGGYKYKIQFKYSDRDDYKVPGFEDVEKQAFWTKKRLNEIEVLTDGQLVRKYIFDNNHYTDTICSGTCPDNSNKHLLLLGIKHKDRNGQGDLPDYSFEYDSLTRVRGYGPSLGDWYLISADNGYGGQVEYKYEWVEQPPLSDRRGDTPNFGVTSRARVKEKIIHDGMNNSFKEIYEYLGVQGYAQESEAGKYHYDFLGHLQTTVKLTEKNNPLKIVSWTKSYYHQALRKDGCFRVDPRKGTAYLTELYNSSGDKILTKTELKNGVEINGEVKEAHELQNDSCEIIPGSNYHEEIDARFFVFNRRSDNFITDFPGAQKRTASVNLEYDFVFGNLEKSVQYGEVDFNSGADLDPGDNKYSFTEYAAPDLAKWLISLPSHTYLSDSESGQVKFQETFYEYNEQGLPIQTRVKAEDSGFEAVSRVEYNRYGLPAKSWDARGGLTETVYDARFPQFPVKSIAYLDNDRQLATQTEYDDVLGLPIKTIDPNEQESRVEYDHYGRVLAMFGPLDSADQPGKTYQYFDPLPDVQIGSKVFEAGELSVGSYYHYNRQIFNGLGQTIQSQVLKTIIEGQEQDVLTTIEFNSRGQAIKQSQAEATAPRNEALPRFYEIDWNQAIRTETSYDDLGRPILARSVVPGNPDLNSENRLAYAGWTTWSRAERERGQFTWLSEIKDAFGRTASGAACLDPSYPENCPQDQKLISYFQYDLLDNVVESWSEKAGQATPKSINHYDYLGRRLGFDDPDLGAWRLSYDQNNNLVSQIDAKNQEIRFEYDALNRLTKKIYPDSQEVVFEYDAFDPSAGQYGRGRQTKMIDPTGFTETRYNQAGLPVWSQKQIFDQTVITETEYYVSGLIKSLVQADGERISYQYNQIGQMIGVTGDQQGNYLSAVRYNRFGAVSEQVFGNQTQTTTNYDDLGRLIQLGNFNYQFDLLGSIKAWDNLNFNYDPLSRLLSAGGFYQAEYQYDPFGRMGLKKEADQSLIMTYDNSSPFHAPKRVGESQYQYDANGNLLADGEREYTWNYDNKPLAIKDKQTGTMTYFAYDGAGERVLRKVAGVISASTCISEYGLLAGETDFNNDGLINGLDFGLSLSPQTLAAVLYFGGHEKILDESGGVAEEKTYLSLPHATVLKILPDPRSGQGGDRGSYYLLQDHLASTRLITDQAGEIVAEYDYYPYGNLASSHRGGTTEHLYTSQTLDPSTNLYYYHARYYNPQTASFLSADSAEGPNRYAYVAGNPISRNDPSGKSLKVPLRMLGMTEEDLAYEGQEPENFWQELEQFGVSLAYSVSPWIPEKWEAKLGGTQKASMNLNSSLMMVSMVSAPAALPTESRVFDWVKKLTEEGHTQFKKLQPFSSNRARVVLDRVMREVFESDIGEAIRSQAWDEAIGQMGKAGLTVEAVEPSVLRNLGKGVSNQATVQGNKLLIEKAVLQQGGKELGTELFHEYTAWWAQQRGWERGIQQFSYATRIADAIANLISW